MKKIIITLCAFVQSIFVFGQAPDFVWAKKAGGFFSDYPNGIAVDTLGNTYITGVFRETATFGNIELTAPITGTQQYGDAFIAKLDPAGNFLWVKQAEGVYEDVGNDIAVDASGNVYITGRFTKTAYFGDAELTNSGDNGNPDIYITKLDTDGNFLWTKKAGGTLMDFGASITVDTSGNIYVTGIFFDTATFGNIELTASGNNDFIAKLDADGNFL